MNLIPPPAAAAGPDAARRWNRVYWGLYLGYIVLGMTLRWNGWLAFDHIWFVDAARHILTGDWRIYDFRPQDPNVLGIAPPDGLAYSYSPLPALLMAPFVALADALGATPLAAGVGGADGLADRLIAFPLLVADVLAMDQFRRLARAWRPAVDETALFLGILPTLLLTGFLQVSANRDHQEGLVLLFLLLTLRLTPRNWLLGGVLAGLTLAAKQTAVLELLPLGLVLLFSGMPGSSTKEHEDSRREQKGMESGGDGGAKAPTTNGPSLSDSRVRSGRFSARTGARTAPVRSGRFSALADAEGVVRSGRFSAIGLAWGAIAAAVFGAFLLPPFLAHPDALVYAFITQEQRRVLSGQGLPVWIDQGVAALLGTGSTSYAGWHVALIQWSNAALVLVAAALMVGALAWNARRGCPIGLIDSRLLALVALGGLLQIVLAKWVTGHYYQLPLALVLLWDTVRVAPRWPLLGLAGTLGFRAITVAVNLPAVPQVKDGLLFALFAALTGATLMAAYRAEPRLPVARPGMAPRIPTVAPAGWHYPPS